MDCDNPERVLKDRSTDHRPTWLRFGPVITSGVTVLLLSWFGRIVQNKLRELFHLEGLLFLVLLLSLVFALVAVKIFEPRGKISSLMLLVYPLGVFLLRDNPEEGVHLVEYAIFALSVEWSQSIAVSDERRIAIGIVCGGLLGLADEVLQAINPERYFDLRDIIFNFLGVAAVTVAVRVKVRP